MERSRSKRSYHYDSDSQTPPPPRGKPRYDAGSGAAHHRRPNHRRRGGASPAGDRWAPPPPPPPPPLNGPPAATTFFRILCPESLFPAAFGKSGAIIKSLRQDTGAWIDVHQLVPGDNERIIETSDDRRREPDGRPPQFSPAQEALLLIHDRILGDDDFPAPWGGARDRAPRVTTRLVVPRGNVGCLLGKGGKIIEQMRMETKTHIRILPRDQYTPRCVSAAEEIVQVAGEGSCVKKAVAVISSRIKQSLHRDQAQFRAGRLHSPEQYPPNGDEFMSNAHHRSVSEGSDFGPRSSVQYPYEDIVFRILCPNNKIESVINSSDGIMEKLRDVVGVDVRVTDPIPGLDERVIIITSDEGLDDELFPAQEALLHIQTRIVDLGPDKDNIITTRLLVPSSEIGCFEGRNGSLSDIQRLTNTNVQFVPRELLPPGVSEADELLQIVGEIRAARKALVQVTEKLRSYLYRDISVPKDMVPPSAPPPVHIGSITAVESRSPVRSLPREVYQGVNPTMAAYQNMHAAEIAWQSKDTGGCASGAFEQEESNMHDEIRQSAPKRFNGPLVTKSTLEVIIPKHAVPSLMIRSGSKLAQISEMSGASVCLLEDRPEQTEKIVQISGSPEQTERAQSLLQGFILSTQDDIPSS